MPVNDTLATYSDWLYRAAALVYVFAMIFYTIEQAFTRKAKKSEFARELIGAGAPTTPDTPAVGRIEEPAGAGKPERFGRIAVALTVLGALLHLGSIVTRGVATGRAPWGNMYEYGAATMFVAVVAWLVLLRKFDVRRLGAFVLTPVVILMFLGGTALYTSAGPVMPALQSYWLVVHVSAAILSSGLFLVPGVVSVLYLVKVRHDANPAKFAKIGPRLPAAESLDRLAYRTTIFAFPIYTFGIICGAIWAEAAWGRFWGWDPKETVAFVAWVVYAGYLHSRATAGWRGSRAAIINSVAFALVVFNLFFINLVIAGLHSYA
ncbi:c-type cytochrome biogenesis protein CcsB [Actinokineospora globicatena]|uniref:c-type cytochrome biogenesis protein CcsB n=1 Tax=Actinokineospora globicatena TaxID=103729 RepID=UPI0020A342A0|nr:c-type cytochrome biogenesis protein CcsB [Actinokineospora globicatena]MCP2301703.1 cytochrome c-type biogenesis protein CcsB [Actinokineospora globicatena]GLW76641.1 c-type cytochrome biogenesis protein CcsB [Actinokineospora globicatena]GLW83475.1 c-type cytochrome biogenesis protein CcsB [Actinokineospora globicatena]